MLKFFQKCPLLSKCIKGSPCVVCTRFAMAEFELIERYFGIFILKESYELHGISAVEIENFALVLVEIFFVFKCSVFSTILFIHNKIIPHPCSHSHSQLYSLLYFVHQCPKYETSSISQDI